MKMDPVVHFEMPAKDKARVRKFYEQAFGWHMVQLDEKMGNYILATTTDTDPKTGMIKTPGNINGGFFEYQAGKPGMERTSVVIAVDNLEESIKKVKAAGGKVLGGGSPNKKNPEDPDDIPGVGLYVAIEDSEGNRVGMLQPAPMSAQK